MHVFMLERKSDDEFFSIAKRAFSDTITALESGDLRVSLYDGDPTRAMTSLILNNHELLDVGLWFMCSDDEENDSLKAYANQQRILFIFGPSILKKYFPNSKGDFSRSIGRDFAKFLRAARSIFMHEFRHIFDARMKNIPMNVPKKDHPTDDQAQVHRDYFNRDNEMNANITAVIDSIIEEFEEKFPKATGANAQKWLPTTTAMIDKFMDASKQRSEFDDIRMLDYVDRTKWMRRGAARFVNAWERYIRSLPH